MKLKQLVSEVLVKIDDTSGYSLMHGACVGGNARFVKKVLNRHFVDILYLENLRVETAEKRYREKTCREIVSELANEGQKEILQTLDEANDDWQKLSELHKAVQRGTIDEVVSLVVDQGMDVNTAANRRETALHWASVNGSKEVVETLLELGADISAQTDEGLTTLHMACLHNNFSVASCLLVNKTNKASVLAKTSRGDYGGSTALHIAARRNAVRIADLLLVYGASLAERDNRGQTPLHIAACHGQEKMSELFLTRKADPHAKDNNGQTPLHLCAAKGHEKVVETLLANKVLDINRQVNSQDNMGFTPLHRAAENSRIAVAETLIRRKANVNMQTKQNLAERIFLVQGQCEGIPSWKYIFVHSFKLALFEKMAQEQSIPKTAFKEFGQEILCGYGEKPDDDLRSSIANEASAFVLDNGNETPLHLACKKGHNEIVRILLEANENLVDEFSARVDVYRCDAEGFMPFHNAVMYGHVKTVELLLKKSPGLTEKSVEFSSAGENEPVTMTPADLAAANDVNMDEILKTQKEPRSSDADVAKKPDMTKIQTKNGKRLSQKLHDVCRTHGGIPFKEKMSNFAPLKMLYL